MTINCAMTQFSCVSNCIGAAQGRRDVAWRPLVGAVVAAVGLALWLGAGVAVAQETDDSPAPTAATLAEALAGQQSRGAVTNLPLPRFVSLKGSEGNARRGPSLSHRIDWVFRHVGMPLRITAEFGHWRRVEDRDGAGGWVHYSLLSGVRTVIVEDDMTQLHARPDPNSAVVALAEAGAIAQLGDCRPDWCEIAAEDAEGWVLKDQIWGVDPAEIRD